MQGLQRANEATKVLGGPLHTAIGVRVAYAEIPYGFAMSCLSHADFSLKIRKESWSPLNRILSPETSIVSVLSDLAYYPLLQNALGLACIGLDAPAKGLFHQ